MQYQEKRGILYVVTNVAVCALFFIFGLKQGYWPGEDRARWARLLLIFILAQIIVRAIAIIAFAVVHKIAADEETVFADDELDERVDLKATRLFFYAFMACFALAVGTQAIGLSVQALFLGLAAAVMVAGIVGDLSTIVFYRRGV